MHLLEKWDGKTVRETIAAEPHGADETIPDGTRLAVASDHYASETDAMAGVMPPTDVIAEQLSTAEQGHTPFVDAVELNSLNLISDHAMSGHETVTLKSLDDEQLTIYELETSVLEKQTELQGGWAFLGHLLTYSGLISIAVGAGLLAILFLDGPDEFAALGGLGVICGQMMLFLGVVIQITTRMNRNTRRLMDRIDLIGNRVSRIEQSVTKTEDSNRLQSESSVTSTTMHQNRPAA